jgi:cobalt-zinc-cadmium efflux system membrane fusion protein
MPVLPNRSFGGAAVALALLTAASVSIHLAASSPPGPTASPSPRAPDARAASVDLEAGQLDGLRIEPAALHSFPSEKQAVGSISFDEDPAIVQSESTLLTASANLELSSKELSRVERLGEGNGIAQKEHEQAIANEQSARAALKAARDALRALGKSDSEIDGMLASGTIPNGSRSHRVWALANVAESDSVSVRPGQPLSLTVMAYPGRTFSGKVSRVYAAVDPATHRVAVRAEIADPRAELRAGMLAEFTIRVSPAAQSVAIPANGAVREADGTTSVWVTADRRHFAQRTVKTGARDAGWVQILEGVRSGELIVTDGAVFLSNMLQAPPGD